MQDTRSTHASNPLLTPIQILFTHECRYSSLSVATKQDDLNHIIKAIPSSTTDTVWTQYSVQSNVTNCVNYNGLTTSIEIFEDGMFRTIRDSSNTIVCSPKTATACTRYPWLTTFTVTSGYKADLTISATDYEAFSNWLR